LVIIFRTLIALALAVCFSVAAAFTQPGRTVRPKPADDAIADALRSHSIVMIAEHHQSAPLHTLLRALIASPKIRDRVDDIVVEFANPLYQPIIDRYVAGATVPIDSLRLAWRNTTQLLVWDSPLYEEFFRAVRRLNTAGTTARPLRIVAGDSPIDWSRTSRASDIPRSFGFRDIETLRVLEREVLGKGRRAIVIIGEEHVPRMTDTIRSAAPKPLERATLGEALHRAHPGAAYLIATVIDERSPLARAVKTWPRGSIADIRETTVGLADATSRARARARAGEIARAAAHRSRLQDQFDAVLYVAPTERIVEQSGDIYRNEPTYEREIRRRIGVLTQFYGIDIWTADLDRLTRGRAPSR
jgi:hypothetical protein